MTSPAQDGVRQETAAAAAVALDLGAAMDPGIVTRIVQHARSMRIPAGRVIVRKDDPPGGCYLILKGAVKVSLPGDGGQERLLAVLGEGDVVGEMAMLDRRPRSATVTALKACEVIHLTTATFERLARTDLAICRELLRMLSVRLRAGNETNMARYLALGCRLARVFLELARGFGQKLPDGRVLIRQKVSQAELACMVGATRESVNRQLGAWRKGGMLTRISGYYCLAGLASFKPLAQGEAAAADAA